MASTPRFKVYFDGEYVAACKYAEDAAVLCAARSGGQVKLGHRRILWDEGNEATNAADSYDVAAETMLARAASR